LLPFDANLARTRPLCRRLGVDLLPAEQFTDVDRLSRHLWPEGTVGLLRRLGVFWGPYEHFIYLDADVLAVQPVEPLLAAVQAHEQHVLYLDGNLDEVYKPGPLRAEMVTTHAARGMNAGVFGGARGVLTIGGAQRIAADFTANMDQMIPLADQTFLNYLLDRSDVRCLAFADVLDVCGGWAGHGYHRHGHQWVQTPLSPTQTPAGRLVLLHWAGLRLTPRMPYYRLWLTCRVPHGRRSLFTIRLGAPLLLDRIIGPLRARLRLRTRLRALGGAYGTKR
jgi:hypothetical protein